MRSSTLSVLNLDLTRSRKKDGDLLEYLRERGFPVKTVRALRRAEQALQRGDAHVVFVLLAGRAGATPEILRRLHHADSDTPIVVISRTPCLEEAVSVLRERAWDYLSAPVSWDDLDECVQKIIEEKGIVLSPEARLNQAVGERIRQARLDRALTLRQLANRTGLSTSLISQIELARSSASVATLLKLSRALKLRLSEIFAGF